MYVFVRGEGGRRGEKGGASMDGGSDWCEARDLGVDGELCDGRKGGIVDREDGEACEDGRVGGKSLDFGLIGGGVDGILMKSNSKLFESLTGVRLFFLREDLETGELGTDGWVPGLWGDGNLRGKDGDLKRVRPFFFVCDGRGTKEVGVDE